MTNRDEVIAATKAAERADHTWQAALDHFGIDRYSVKGRTYLGLRELYEAKLEADEVMRQAWDKSRAATRV